MAKKDSRRNESIRLAIVILLLAISQAFAPPLFLGGKFGFGPTAEKHQSKRVLEAAKHDWLGLAHAKPDPKHKGSVERRDCLRWRPGAKVHCVTAGGVAEAGIRIPHDNDSGKKDTDFGGVQGSGGESGGLDSGGYVVIGDFSAGLSNGDSGGDGAGGASSSAAGNSFTGGGSGIGGSIGGGTIGGGSGGGSSSSGDNSSAGGSGGEGTGGGGSVSDGTGGGGTGGGSSGSGDNSGGGQSGGEGTVGGDSVGDGAGGAVERIFSDPGLGCGSDNPSGCIPGDPGSNGSDCSLKNPEACTADGTGNPGDTDCPDPKLCQLPLNDVVLTTPVPEPSTLWLIGAGIAALAAMRRRKKFEQRA